MTKTWKCKRDYKSFKSNTIYNLESVLYQTTFLDIPSYFIVNFESDDGMYAGYVKLNLLSTYFEPVEDIVSE